MPDTRTVFGNALNCYCNLPAVPDSSGFVFQHVRSGLSTVCLPIDSGHVTKVSSPSLTPDAWRATVAMCTSYFVF